MVSPDEDFRTFWQAQVKAAGGSVVNGVFDAGIDHFAWKGVFAFDGSVGEARGRVQELQKSRQPFSWFVWQRDAELEQMLLDEGLTDFGGLDGVRLGGESFARIRPVDLDVAWVDESTAMAFTETLRKGSDLPTDFCTDFAKQKALLDHPDMAWALAYVDGAPVATACLHTGLGVAGMYNGAVLPEFRRQGIATQLLQVMMARSHELGCKEAVAVVNPPSLPFLVRHGFEHVGHYGQYVWVP